MRTYGEAVTMGKSRGSRYRSERLLHPRPAATHHVPVAVADHLADLQEEDVWSVLAAPAPDSSGRNCRQPAGEQDRRGGRWAAGGLSLAFDAHAHGGTAAMPAVHHHRHVAPAASSAPVKVPEWPGAQQGSYREHESSEEGEWVAPHEYVQGRGGGRTATASVFEGVGRTLKGRDLSRVRDAVWSNTGFFG